MDKVKEILKSSGYAQSTTYSFLNGSRFFLMSRQKMAIKKALAEGCIEEILSLPDELSNHTPQPAATSSAAGAENPPKERV